MSYYDDETITIVIDDSFGVLFRFLAEMGNGVFGEDYDSVPSEVKFVILRDYDLHKIAKQVLYDDQDIIRNSNADVSIADRSFNMNKAVNALYGGIINIMSGDGGVANNLGQRLGRDYLDYIVHIIYEEYQQMIDDGVITPDMFTERI